MRTAADLNTLRADRTQYRAAIDTIRSGIAALERSYHSNSSSPRATVAALIEEIGKSAAAAAVATLTNLYAWDGRISRSSRAWAEGIADAWSEDAAREMRLFTGIHRAHLDQIAQTMTHN